MWGGRIQYRGVVLGAPVAGNECSRVLTDGFMTSIPEDVSTGQRLIDVQAEDPDGSSDGDYLIFTFSSMSPNNVRIASNDAVNSPTMLINCVVQLFSYICSHIERPGDEGNVVPRLCQIEQCWSQDLVFW